MTTVLPPAPTHVHNLEFVRIMTPYIFAQCIVANKWVLDVGCGFGHGAWLMAKRGARRVVALDIDRGRVSQMLSSCKDSLKVAGVVMDAEVPGFLDQAFDIVICFEVIEHSRRPDCLLRELRRVLKPKGILLLSTPNRSIRLHALQHPWNPEHLREYTQKAIRRTLNHHFPVVEIVGVFGEPQYYWFYRTMWRSSPVGDYFGRALRAVRPFVPASVRGWMKAGHLSSTAPVKVDLSVPRPEPNQWPFYLKKIGGEECLNFFALCGFERGPVENMLEVIQDSGSRSSRD
jgi:SAM-dependent methyltransferase